MLMKVFTSFLFFTILCLAPIARCHDLHQSTSKNSQEQQNFQTGRKEDDRIKELPGQPPIKFSHYSGYVPVGPNDEKALFYYFTESEDPTNKPLALWLTGGPGCSSFGFGAMTELGPFRVYPDRKTLWYNQYSWNKAANVLFLESPAGVGFSYSTNKADYITGDKNTAQDTYTFLVKWLQKFPEYKNRPFYITGSSYAGHFVTQLADLILTNNKIKKPNNILINLKGIFIGNAEIDETDAYTGQFDYMWTHALISDETHKAIIRNCDFSKLDFSDACINYMNLAGDEAGNINPYNIYALSSCDLSSHATPDLQNFNPCSMKYVTTYLNNVDVQKALHVNVINGKPRNWTNCNPQISKNWTDSPNSVLPIIKNLMANGVRVLLNSGDIDGVIPVTSTEYSISKLAKSVQVPWYPWCSDPQEVGGYAVGYNENMVFATLRGAGHGGAVDQPKRALTLFASFLAGKLPPRCGN
ncbi:Serine carboxypeptidase 24 [Striga hermonthica]|uniref:Serine carboxypeptidase 24 n=1 Tax=Striga hermonthica TaxID=68872 RepID=A0A9N7NBY0_STRHE|nr:Serine carboxypeptidase 24 [Striga hermonthica]